jgi:glycerol-3-phosphate O-acyltransferase
MPDLPAPRDDAQLFRSGMIRRFGPLFHLSGLSLLLRRAALDESSAENIRRAATDGSVVYVMHTTSAVDWLALNRALNARRLPLATLTAGVRGIWFRPVYEALYGAYLGIKRRLALSGFPDPVASGALTDAVRSGRPAAIFLVENHKPTVGVLKALIDAQADAEQPVQIVPVVVRWRRAPGAARTESARMLRGSADDPGVLEKMLIVLSADSAVHIQAGAPVDLSEVLSRDADEPDERIRRRLRILLRRYLYRESRVATGPRIRSYRWMERLVLRSPEVRRLVLEESLATGRSEEKIRSEVRATFSHIAARLSFPVVRASRAVFNLLAGRIFSGIDIREEDLERLREALRAGTPVLIPCHRSHFDYMLLSSVCYEHNLVIPHIVAGENLSFWPVGALFRRAGAFFIKRSFGEDRIFPVIFKRYLQQLIRDGFPVEFFIEGGRSRTGKLLPARLGVLSMVLDAAETVRADHTISLLPISITYEQIAEGGAYARELAGEKKQAEDIGQVVAARRVFGKRFGRVYIRVGTPITTAEAMADLDAPWSSLPRERRAEVLQRTGEHILYRIACNEVVLPSGLVAMALLCQPRRGVRQSVLLSRVTRFDALMRDMGAKPAASLTYGGWAVHSALERFRRSGLIARLTDESDDIIQLIEEKRIELDYYKNGLIHFVAPMSLLAAAARVAADEDGLISGDELLRLFRTQVFLMRYEFTLDPDQALETLEVDSLARLVAYGALSVDDRGHRIAELPLLAEIAGLTCNFLESYRLVLLATRATRSRDVPVKELPEKILEFGRGRLAVDELSRSESLSVVNLNNALRAFREEGVIQLRTGGGLQFDDAGLEQYLADLEALLG